jgi:hypothetical protein
VLGLLFTSYFNYRAQLQSRRLWRARLESEQRQAAAAERGPSGGVRYGQKVARYGVLQPEPGLDAPPSRDTGLDLRPVYGLHLPVGIALLVLTYMACHHFNIVQQMV